MVKTEKISKLKIGKINFSPEEKVKEINPKKIMNIVSSKVVPFSKSGAYIPISQEYKNHKVYVIVMEDKEIKSAKEKK
ncbi:hypothetical protein M0R72_09510 [Candidatus Pacearchaeota archaeon]|nr:hypothetical protein [Candidatus Pacearchaeota archaeon]